MYIIVFNTRAWRDLYKLLSDLLSSHPMINKASHSVFSYPWSKKLCSVNELLHKHTFHTITWYNICKLLIPCIIFSVFFFLPILWLTSPQIQRFHTSLELNHKIHYCIITNKPKNENINTNYSLYLLSNTRLVES